MPEENFFIATQGPVQTSIIDFWEMILQLKVTMIVMLCELSEGGREKCACYWDPSVLQSAGIKINVEENKTFLDNRKFMCFLA